MNNKNKTPKRLDAAYRDAIIKHALKEFYSKGIKAVTMSQISEDLHISKRTLYEIYNSKEELLMDCLKMSNADYHKKAKVEMEKASNVLEGILNVFRIKIFESRTITPRFIAELHSYEAAQKYFAELHDSLRQQSIEIIQQGVEEGIFIENLDYSIIYDMTGLMADNVVKLHILDKNNIEHIFSSTILCYLRGCTTEQGRRIIEKWTADSI